MSAKDVREQIKMVQKGIKDPYSWYFNMATGQREINPKFLGSVSLLLEEYGKFVGKAKAKHSDFLEEINTTDSRVREYFEYLTKNSNANYCFKLVNLAIGKIAELLSFIEGLEASPPEKKVSKRVYEKLLRENEANKTTIETLIKYKGLPELNKLLEKARNVELPTDEHWVLALCSANLIEAIVNKKLEALKLSTEGNFEKKYRRLANVIKEREQRDIQRLLPLALYKGIRNKLDHASHANRVTQNEAQQISKIVMNLIAEVFQ